MKIKIKFITQILVLIAAVCTFSTKTIAQHVSVQNEANYAQRKVIDIALLGAKNDGKTLNTAIIQAAIDECSLSGGGTVYVAGGGKYLTGTLNMKSFVTLHIDNGTTLLGSPDISDYTADTHKNMYKNEPHMDKCLIFAHNAESFAFEGHGTIDGNGYRNNFSQERPMMMRFLNCRNIHLTNLNLVNPASWTSAWLYCDDITVSGIWIHSRANYNGDGLDFDGCTNVRVSNSSFDTSDDSICLQTSRTDQPCRDVTISNCIFCSEWAGIRIGLLSRGDICSVTVTNCTFRNINDSGLKIQMNEGAELKNMTFSNLVMENVPRPVFMTFCWQRACVDAPMELAPMKYMGNFVFQNIIVDNSKGDKNSCFFFSGMPEKKIENIKISDIQLFVSGGGTDEDAARDSIPEFDSQTLGDWWPEFYLLKGAMPASGLFARHINGLIIKNFIVKTLTEDKRDKIKLVDVDNILSGIEDGKAYENGVFAVTKNANAVINNLAENWMTQEELNRTQYIPVTYENTGDSLIITAEELWLGKDSSIMNDDLEETIICSYIDDGIFYKESYFTSREVTDNFGKVGAGGKVRIYAIYGATEGAKNLPAVLHVHGGGQTVNKEWVSFWAKRGYAALTIDWGGKWDNNPGRTEYAKYPVTLVYANHQSANHNSDEGRAETNCWYEWTYACRRALTYLGTQNQVNTNRMGVLGISMGGTLTWMISASDVRVKAAAPIYGAGFDYDYRNYNQPETGTGSQYDPSLYNPTNPGTKRYLTAITCEAVAKYITAPVLFINATNDQHGNMDFSTNTINALPVNTIMRQTYAPNFVHHISTIQQYNLQMWMDAFLKDEGYVFAKNPKITIKKAPSGKPIAELTVDNSKKINDVKVYYALETESAFDRSWTETKDIIVSGNIYKAEIDVLNLDKHVFVYASVTYEDGSHLSTSPFYVKPSVLDCTIASAKRSTIIYDEDEGIDGWATQSIGTDPIIPVPTALKTGPNGKGVIATNGNYELMTFRLFDPRFEAPSNDSKLRLTFEASQNSIIGIYMHNTTYAAGNYGSIYTKNINISDGIVEFGLPELVTYKGGNKPTSWNQAPVIQLENKNNAVLKKIEWISSN